MRLAPAKSTGAGTSPHTMPTSVPTTGNWAGNPAAAQASRSIDGRWRARAEQLDVHVGVELVERGEPGRRGQRVAGQRAGVEHRAERRQRLHDVAPAADGADRQAAADDLAERREVGRDVVLRLRAAGVEPEPGDHLVEDQQRADPVALGPQALEEPGLRGDDAHVGGDRLDDHGGDVVVERGHLVVRHDERLGDRAGRHAGRAGQAERGDAAAAGGEQRVGGAVEVAVERDDPVAARCSPRARRTAVLVASVPEFISRTRSQLGTRSPIASASFISRGVGAPYDVPSRAAAADRAR